MLPYEVLVSPSRTTLIQESSLIQPIGEEAVKNGFKFSNNSTAWEPTRDDDDGSVESGSNTRDSDFLIKNARLSTLFSIADEIDSGDDEFNEN